jgi:hypothetical protein
MKTKNLFLIISGLINLFTFLLHVIGGQISLINPLLDSNLELQVKTELLGVWHMVTIILFITSIILLYWGFKQNKKSNIELLSFIGYLYILFSVPFVIISIIYGLLVPQWILLLPIGILTIIGIKKIKKDA